MNTLRTMTGYTMWDRKMTACIREICKMPDVVRWAEEEQGEEQEASYLRKSKS